MRENWGHFQTVFLCMAPPAPPLPGAVSVSAGGAPAEGSVPASAARQTARAEKRTAEDQADDRTGGGTHPNSDRHHHPGNYSLLHLRSLRGQRSGSNAPPSEGTWPVKEHVAEPDFMLRMVLLA